MQQWFFLCVASVWFSAALAIFFRDKSLLKMNSGPHLFMAGLALFIAVIYFGLCLPGGPK